MKASEIIRESKHVLFDRGWTQRDTEGADGSVCLVGALNVAEYGDAARSVVAIFNTDVRRAVVAAVEYPHPFGWNDYPGRTFDDVIDALDRAEKIAEQREALDVSL